MFTFIESSIFERVLPVYLDDDEYAELQQYLVRNPEAGDIVPGTDGVRKVRWARPGWAAGHLFRSIPAERVLDADALCEGKARECSRAYPQAVVGGVSR